MAWMVAGLPCHPTLSVIPGLTRGPFSRSDGRAGPQVENPAAWIPDLRFAASGMTARVGWHGGQGAKVWRGRQQSIPGADLPPNESGA